MTYTTGGNSYAINDTLNITRKHLGETYNT